MIKSMKPVTLAETKEIVDKMEERKELKDYLKKFTKLKKDKADKLIEELGALENLKLKDEFIVKIVDFLPKNAEDLSKIFTDVSLDEKEINDILNIIKEY